MTVRSNCLLGGWHTASFCVAIVVLLYEPAALRKPTIDTDTLAVGELTGFFGLTVVPPRLIRTVVLAVSIVRLSNQLTARAPEFRFTVRLAIDVLRFTNTATVSVVDLANLNLCHALTVAA